MHVPEPQRTDLGPRRRRAGASRETMAAGLGLTTDEIRALEDGTAPAPRRTEYAQWLDRIEAWPAEQRARQLLAAGGGQRFDP